MYVLSYIGGSSYIATPKAQGLKVSQAFELRCIAVLRKPLVTIVILHKELDLGVLVCYLFTLSWKLLTDFLTWLTEMF